MRFSPYSEVNIILYTVFPCILHTSFTYYFSIPYRHCKLFRHFILNISRGLITSDWSVFLSVEALKESFIKAIGTGLGFDLQRAEFHISPNQMREGQVYRQTRMHLDNEEEDWTFEVCLHSIPALLTSPSAHRFILSAHETAGWGRRCVCFSWSLCGALHCCFVSVSVRACERDTDHRRFSLPR